MEANGKQPLTTVSCSVMTCAYNQSLHCTAAHIYVGTEYASDVMDTVCASFRHIKEPKDQRASRS